MTRNNAPTIIVILGGTGDLTLRKIVPALANLKDLAKLPQYFHLIGFSRRDYSLNQYHDFLRTNMKTPVAEASLDSLLTDTTYMRGDLDNPDAYHALAKRIEEIESKWGVCANKLFYLAVPPEYYDAILHNIATSGLTKECSDLVGWTRVLVEKPFGKDLESARKLDDLLGELFREDQIYRIDHYLAKEMVQNIISFRFANNLFENIWSSKTIEKIHIRLWETLGVEKRGAFYDGMGALRDVGHNHVLQMLALITMNHPASYTSGSIRDARAHILDKLPIFTPDQIEHDTYRAQYNGYSEIAGVAPESQTETYFKLRMHLNSKRWSRTPIVIEAGKRMGQVRKDVTITLRHPIPCLCPPESVHHMRNEIVISLEPTESIKINFFAKKPGFDYELEPRSIEFMLRPKESSSQYVEEYKKLLLDCIAGDQTLFCNTHEVDAMWRFIDPIVAGWQKNIAPLHTYTPDTIDASSASAELDHHRKSHLSKKIGIIGLGKMGGNIARRLVNHGWEVYGYNRTFETTQKLGEEGVQPTKTIKELVTALPTPRIVLVSLTAGQAVDDALSGPDGLTSLLEPGDIVIDGGNSQYKDSQRRGAALAKLGIKFVDVGISGGPTGALHGACLMIGGDRESFAHLQPLFIDMAREGAYRHFEGLGAGHFVKMVHNGIEYGMMQAIAEGMEVLKESPYDLNLREVAQIYNEGSVIESRLTGWLEKAYEVHGQDLADVTSTVAHTGEGQWTVDAAREEQVPVPIIEGSLDFRKESAAKPSYAGRVLSALREQFGGHKAK